MKFLAVVLSVSLTLVLAADDKAAERPKTFRRLIPADVLRGKNFRFFLLKVFHHPAWFA
jgi:hypothetical protein